VRPERDPDLPWVRYRYITSDRMRVLTGRNHVEMTCAICGIRELRVLRIPRFGPVPSRPAASTSPGSSSSSHTSIPSSRPR
jgi:hypothetical protein